MKSLVFILTILIFFSSCNKQEQVKPVSLQKTTVPTSVSVPVEGKTGSSATSDDFSDLKKEDDESCDSEEELLKKQIEKAQKAKTQGVKLQGAGDEGCTVN